MRESNFIKQNKKKWQEFEQLLQQGKKDPDKLSSHFVQLTDDLSYSRTFYPTRSIKLYLNTLAQQVYNNIYKNRKTNLKTVSRFWLYDMPYIVWQSRKELLLSLFIFALAMAIGVFSSIQEPMFARQILGDDYVAMTEANISKGDPLAVYKKARALDMFLGITINNLWVAFQTFIFGIFYMVGTIAILLNNGIMVGTFQYFFIERGLFWESFLTIWQHGTLEISAIVIAGGAGLTLGRGLVFPGTYSRGQAFRMSALRGLKIMMSLVPVFIFAGFIEGFFTRFTDMHDAIRLLVIILSLGYILGYYAWYPFLMRNKGFPNADKVEKITPQARQKINLKDLNNNGEIFTGVFVAYKRHLRPLLLTIAGGAVVVALLLYFVFEGMESTRISFWQWSSDYFLFHFRWPYIILLTLYFAVVDFVSKFFILHEEQNRPAPQLFSKNFVNFFLRHFYKSIVAAAIVAALMHLIFIMWNLTFINWFFLLFMLAILSFVIAPVYVSVMASHASMAEGTNIFKGFARATTFIAVNYMRVVWLGLSLMFISFVVTLIFNSPFIWGNWQLWYIIQSIAHNFQMGPESSQILVYGLITFLSLFLMGIIVPIWSIGMAILFYTLREIQEAPYLSALIKNIGKTGAAK